MESYKIYLWNKCNIFDSFTYFIYDNIIFLFQSECKKILLNQVKL